MSLITTDIFQFSCREPAGSTRLFKLALNATLPQPQFLYGRDARENYDGLTGLANRILFESRLDIARARMKRSNRAYALLILDIDSFTEVNDIYGAAAGDELLQQFSLRLKTALRHSDTIARFGGDDFAILIEDLTAQQDGAIVAERVIALLAEPFLVCGSTVRLEISIGIAACAPEQDLDCETLMRRADAAMHDAKLRPGNFYRSFAGLLAHLALASAEDEMLISAE